jgi:hypothetical protein
LLVALWALVLLKLMVNGLVVNDRKSMPWSCCPTDVRSATTRYCVRSSGYCILKKTFHGKCVCRCHSIYNVFLNLRRTTSMWRKTMASVIFDTISLLVSCSHVVCLLMSFFVLNIDIRCHLAIFSKKKPSKGTKQTNVKKGDKQNFVKLHMASMFSMYFST